MKKLLLLSSSMVLMPLCTISCIKNNFNSNKYSYVEKNNYANDYGDFAYLNNNFLSENIRKINLATSAKLFRIKSSQQPLIDFRDNIVLIPSSISYNFEWAKKVKVVSKLNSYEFDNDMIDIVEYNPENNNEEAGIFKPKKDKGNGFNSAFLNIPSSDQKSINNNNFKKSLKEAKSFEIFVHEMPNVWLNYQGIKQKNSFINIKSFKLGLFASLLKNKDFRKNYAKKHNIALGETNNKNEAFNGFDLYTFLRNNKINVEKLLSLDTNSLTIETNDNSFIDLNNIFENLFIIQNYFDAIPFEIIEKKYGNPFLNIKWFFEYGKNYKNRYFAGFYYIYSSNSNEVILEKNKFYIKPIKKSLRQIKIEYNPLKISENTFSSQITNAFKQNIVSKINYEQLSLDDKNYILKNYKKYNFSYQKNFNRYRLNNSIIINHNPNINTPYMNNNFLKIYYGLDNNLHYSLTAKNLAFQSLFNNIINQYALIEDNKDIWLSQAPQNLLLTASTNGLNYADLKDAFVNISNPIILDFNSQIINNTFQFQNKQKLSNPYIIKISKKIESAWFEKIKNELNLIIEDFYIKKPSNKSIYINIPVLINNKNQFVLSRINWSKKILNSINPKLVVDITLIDDYEKYNEFFNKNKSIYKHNKFNIFEGTSSEYLLSILTNKNNNIINLSKTIKDLNIQDKNVYVELINYQKFIESKNIDNNNIQLSDNLLKIENYINKLNLESQLSLINELNNLLSYTLNFNNQININNFSKIVYQKHIVKPLSPNDLNYFQDILIRGK
ncbi:hypothetical protein DMC14_003125 [Metamycoplasma phocicerebrale]|uniref:Lipoprotein n=1 Tax=Metamycoplasma phocicerebrale TaxID=142649 RepID=A0A3T0TUH0_9BACT|nr:hypothetical protein [Metamycoplasma phocicerebrale]AZZ65755.1 hypothetical protein DMC14_003125 [Metamycoplasma phocicerebrale]